MCGCRGSTAAFPGRVKEPCANELSDHGRHREAQGSGAVDNEGLLVVRLLPRDAAGRGRTLIGWSGKQLKMSPQVGTSYWQEVHENSPSCWPFSRECADGERQIPGLSRGEQREAWHCPQPGPLLSSEKLRSSPPLPTCVGRLGGFRCVQAVHLGRAQSEAVAEAVKSVPFPLPPHGPVPCL